VVQGSAKAWVNFDGTTNTGGNCDIHASYNVSSVADDATGEHTVNFTTALEDANYCFVFGVGDDTTTQSDGRTVNHPGGTRTASALKVRVEIASTGANNDQNYVCVAVFR